MTYYLASVWSSCVPFQKQQKGEESDEELPKGSKPDGLEDDELDEDVESSEEEYVAGNFKKPAFSL